MFEWILLRLVFLWCFCSGCSALKSSLPIVHSIWIDHSSELFVFQAVSIMSSTLNHCFPFSTLLQHKPCFNHRFVVRSANLGSILNFISDETQYLKRSLFCNISLSCVFRLCTQLQILASRKRNISIEYWWNEFVYRLFFGCALNLQRSLQIEHNRWIGRLSVSFVHRFVFYDWDKSISDYPHRTFGCREWVSSLCLKHDRRV